MKTKKFISVLMIFIFAFLLLSTSASAGEMSHESSADDDIIGTISLCSRWSSIFTSGHVWVYITNSSDETIRVGLYDLPPGQGVTLGSFGFTRRDGFGTYYNMEAYRNEKYSDSSCIAITEELSRSELEKVTERLLISNHWDPIINCVFFACRVWNAAADCKIMPFTIPVFTRIQIACFAGDNSDCVIENQPAENSYKQRGNGKKAYLEHVSQASLDA